MKFYKLIFVTIFSLFMLCIDVSYSIADDSNTNPLQIDLMGDSHYSHYNFTDLKDPYKGIDSWGEIKFAYWLNKNKYLSPYLSVIPVHTSEDEFWWQRNVSLAIGAQFYPVVFMNDTEWKGYDYLKSIRIFAMYEWREYYDEPEGGDPEDTDLQFGVDYYYDNLFDNMNEIRDEFSLKNITTLAWTNAGYRKTNFSIDDYEAFLWTGNLKVGFRFLIGNSYLLPYIVADWVYVPKYEDRWWENYLRIGPGIRWYPKVSEKYDFLNDLMRRFNLYFEVHHNVVWLGNEPLKDIEETDYRLGFSFSTGGFYKEIKKKMIQ